MFDLADELYETKKMVTATITYIIDVNKDNVFISEVEDFDMSYETEQDYEDLKRTDEELKNAAISQLSEIIYNAVKYNEIEDMVTVEVHNV